MTIFARHISFVSGKRIPIMHQPPMLRGVILAAMTLTAALAGTVPAEQDQREQPLRLELDLVDGSHIVGVPAIESLPLQTSYARLDIPLKAIRTIKVGADRETMSVELQNGDRLKGAIDLTSIKIQALFGKATIGIELIKGVRVAMAGGMLPASLRKGLVAYYPFDGNANDESGNRQNCTAENLRSVPDRNGKADSAFAFNGRNAYLTTPVTLQGFSAFTLAGWFYTRSYEHAGKYPLCFNQSVNAGRAALMVTRDGELALLVADGESVELQTLATSQRMLLPLNSWHHIAVVFDSLTDNHAIYVDGIKAAESKVVMGAISETAPFHAATIGVNYSPTAAHRRWWDGYMDDLCIYSRALSSNEVWALFSADR